MEIHVSHALINVSGKTKCMMKSGDCVIKHPGVFTVGLQMVVRHADQIIFQINLKVGRRIGSLDIFGRVQSVTFVKLGFAMEENASLVTPVHAPCVMLYAWNVNVEFGTTVRNLATVEGKTLINPKIFL